jgi:LCP family protein required for cell wall assembly
MEEKQHWKHITLPATSTIVPVLLVLACVALLLGFVLAADHSPLHLPTTAGLSQSFADSNGTAFTPGLKSLEVPENSEPDPAASGALQLLESQNAGSPASESPSQDTPGGVTGKGMSCTTSREGEPCAAGEPFLALAPPISASVSRGKTLLLLGVDSRNGGLISRTDTIMLMSINEGSQQISLLSIPRDLYVFIPGHGRDRINTALVYGAEEDNLAAGIDLLKETIEGALGVTIDHYTLVDFRAVIRSIDALGGIDVYVPYDINDPTFPDMNGGFDPLFISQGQHHFSGEMALKYARTRHQDNDFYRSQRQHQILLAIRQQVLNLGVADLLESAPTLYAQIRHGVFTDLSVMQMVQLARAASEVPLDNVTTEVLDSEYVSSSFSDAGEFILILRPRAVTPLIEEMFGN